MKGIKKLLIILSFLFVVFASGCVFSKDIDEDEATNTFENINYDYSIYNLDIEKNDKIEGINKKATAIYNENDGLFYSTITVKKNDVLTYSKEIRIIKVIPKNEMDSYYYVYKKYDDYLTNTQTLQRSRYMVLECSFSFVLNNNIDYIDELVLDGLVNKDDLIKEDGSYYCEDGYFENNYQVYNFQVDKTTYISSIVIKINDNRVKYATIAKSVGTIEYYKVVASYSYDKKNVEKPSNVDEYEWVNSGFAPEII